MRPVYTAIAVAIVALPLLATPVRVRVGATPAGTKIANAYIAFYAPSDPWERPTAEVITSSDVATLEVPPGDYQVFAASKGYEPELEPVRVPDGSSPDVRIELEAPVETRGTVSDASGAAIAGARVSQLRTPTSPRGTAQVGGAFVTSTGEDGGWTLPGPAQRWFPVVIEAPGYAPAYLRSDSTLTDIVLQQGGRLLVQTDRIDEDALVTFLHVEPPAGALVSEERLSVTREKQATSKHLEWSSVAPGEYRVVVRPRQPWRFAPSGELARIRISAGGEAAEVKVVLPQSSAPPPYESFFIQGRAPRELSLLRAWTRNDVGTSEARVATEATVRGTLAYVATSAARGDVYLTTRDELIFPASGRATTVHAKADVQLRIASATAGVALPRAARLDFRECERHRRFDLIAAVARDGLVAFPAPVDCRTLILRARPLEALPLPITLSKGLSKSLGEFSLQAAAEAEVHVTLAPSGVVVPEASVRAISQLGSPNRTVVIAEAIADGSGIAVLEGISAEEDISIEARRPGSTATGTKRLALPAGERTIIDPLEIPEPATLHVEPRLAAAVRSAYPNARIASVSIRSLSNAELRSRSAPVDESDRATFGDVTPGEWRVSALVEAEESVQPVDLEIVQLRPGELRRLEAEVAPLIFKGRVWSDDPAARWSLSIADPPGRHAIRRRVQVGADAQFRAILPRRGSYIVAVTEVLANGGPGETFEIGDIDFRDPGQRVEIAVPSGSLVVRVRDGGKPLPSADVTLTPVGDVIPIGQKNRAIQSDVAGRAHFRGLRAGRWFVRAKIASGRGAEEIISVADNAASEVVLDLDEIPTLHAVVDLAGAPVADAAVHCLVASSTGAFARKSRSDAAGRVAVELAVPPPAAVRCAAVAPNGAVGAAVMDPSKQARLSIVPSVASLVIEDWTEHGWPDTFWLVAPDTRLIGASWLASELRPGTSELVIPLLPAGTWRLVRAATLADLLMIAQGNVIGLQTISEIRLEPGERKTLRLISKDSS